MRAEALCIGLSYFVPERLIWRVSEHRGFLYRFQRLFLISVGLNIGYLNDRAILNKARILSVYRFQN